MDACQRCAPGYFAADLGTTACEMCVNGTSQQPGAVYCQDCEAGQFPNSTEDGPTVCQRCVTRKSTIYCVHVLTHISPDSFRA